MPEDTQRRLAAIVSVDVVGYSRLMGIDEAGTLSSLRTHREQLIDPIIAEYNGRIVKTMGDGLLLEFPSVVNATQCAVAIQKGMAKRNESIEEERRIYFRIGVNLGDIIIDGDDIFGDGVNIASRLEALAEPGGICVRRVVRNQVRDKLDIEFEDMGSVEVKNIARPINVFRVVLAGEQPTNLGLRHGKQRANRLQIFMLAGTVLIAGTAILWWSQSLQFGSDLTGSRTSEISDLPSIAVLPFANLSDDKEQEYFADGIAEDIITDLSKISGLFVIARNSTFTYKGKDIDPGQAAKDLGVRYVLEGSVRRAGKNIRISAQLIDANTRGHLWADRYDGSAGEVFELQDKVRSKIVSALAVRLTRSEELAVAKQETDSPEAYDQFLQGWQRYRERTPEAYAEAIIFLNKAIELDQGYGRAIAALASIYWETWERGWHRSLGLTRNAAKREAEEYLKRALNYPTALAHQVASEMHRQNRQFEEAVKEAEIAIALDPNNADGFVALAGTLIMVGRAREAVQLTKKAMRLDPHYPAFYLYVIGVGSYGDNNFQEAVQYLERAANRNPKDHAILIPLAAAYGQIGRIEDAAQTIQRYVRMRGWKDLPTVAEIADGWPFQSTQDRERLAEGLRLAGLSEQ